MDNSFDREIDAILRQIGSTGAAQASVMSETHPTADDFAAFFEQRLPESARTEFISHLSNCSRCRHILSIQSLAEPDEDQTQKALIAPATPWYRRFQLIPKFAYALAAMFLLFAGLLVFVMLKPPVETEISGIKDLPAAEPDVAANMLSAAAPESSSNQSSSPQKPLKDGNAKVNNLQTTENLNRTPVDSSTANRNSQGFATSLPPPAANAVRSVGLPETTAAEKQTAEAAKMPSAEDAEKDKNKVADEETVNRSRDLEAKAVALAKKKSDSPPAPVNMRQKSESRDIKRFDGKTFELLNGVWIDTAYRGEPVTIVKRRSDSFRSLDKEIQSAVEAIGTPIIIKWGNRALRID